MISVVIPAYNSSETIIQCLDSIKSQTAIELIREVIVVNDGSYDNTLDLLYMYKKNNINFPLSIINKKNEGVSIARNTGVYASKSEWIAFLDSDDFWKCSKVEKQVKIINKYPNINFLGTNRNDEFVKVGKTIDNEYRLRLLSVKNLLFKSWPSVPTVMMKKDFFMQIGGFDLKLNHGEDGDLWLRVAENNQLYYIEDSLVETGFGKLSFGDKGLSADLKKMHCGVKKLINKAFSNKDINFMEKNLFLFYENIKYIRRICITYWRKK